MNPKSEIYPVYYVQKQSNFGDISIPMLVLRIVVVRTPWGPEKPNKFHEPTMCFELQESNGRIDYWPVTNQYQLITLPELKNTI